MQYLTRILKERHLREGFYLEEANQSVYLKRGQHTLTKFSVDVTIKEILSNADGFLRYSERASVLALLGVTV